MFYVLNMLCKLRPIRCAEERAIDGKQPKPVPENIFIFRLSPVTGSQCEELAKGGITEPLAGLGDGAGGESFTCLSTQHEVKFLYNIGDGRGAVKAHVHNQPDPEFSG